MKFLPVSYDSEIVSDDVLKTEFKAAHQIGKVALGDNYFFYREKFKIRYIAYSNIYRIFRRVQLVNMKMCCSRGQLQIQNIVLCSKKNVELAMVDLPDEKSALALIEEMQQKIPEVKIGMKK